MCVIVYKPAGKKFPSWETLKTCFDNNPDGAGFMFLEQDKVQIRKGFMSYKSFKKALSPLIGSNIDMPFVMHFRISTHGGVKPELTQPFPLTDSTERLKATSSYSDVGIAHNGIISMTSYAKQLSDTALFIKEYMTYLVKDYRYYTDEILLDILDELSGSRLCILSKDGHVEMIGKGWVKDEGIYYSNTSYLKSSQKTLFGLSNNFDVFDPAKYVGSFDDCLICPKQIECWGEPLSYSGIDYSGFTCKIDEDGPGACYGCPNEKYCYYL